MTDAELTAYLRSLGDPRFDLAADQIEAYGRGMEALMCTAERIARSRDVLLTALRVVIPLAEFGFQYVHPSMTDTANGWLKTGHLAILHAQEDI